MTTQDIATIQKKSLSIEKSQPSKIQNCTILKKLAGNLVGKVLTKWVKCAYYGNKW
jgi:hypothetical protein